MQMIAAGYKYILCSLQFSLILKQQSSRITPRKYVPGVTNHVAGSYISTSWGLTCHSTPLTGDVTGSQGRHVEPVNVCAMDRDSCTCLQVQQSWVYKMKLGKTEIEEEKKGVCPAVWLFSDSQKINDEKVTVLF
ncbi:hypothetical protein NL108_001148 [Boleophthalmus pectinirostris]|nr:hypothetical protein NL108_001148 [Boleophthalmus pectinirostris]